jgi:(4S)-4-hydroxy-5-phosphonooxypentane-2,3-dione isomerase
MLVVTVAFEVPAAQAELFLAAVVANARASLASEPGCRQFDVAVDPAAAGAIFLYELYDDRAAFDLHLASAHFRDFDARTAGWVARKQVRLLQRIEA